MTDRGLYYRMLLIALVIVGAWSYLAWRLAVLHLGDNAELKAKVERIGDAQQPLLAGRGAIVDTHGNSLALNVQLANVWIDPHHVLRNGHGEAVARQLAKVLRLPEDEVRAIVYRPNRKFEYVKRHVGADEIEQLQRMNLPGVHMEDANTRYYPHGPLLCHVVGFTTRYGDSFYGIEQAYNDELQGKAGLSTFKLDGRRAAILDTVVTIAAEEGCTVELTIDMHVQYLVEEALKTVVMTNRARGAWAVVQEVKTGRILAMASHPDFDPNSFSRGNKEQFLNRVIGYTYEPGSTMKALVFAAAFNEGLLDPYMEIDCEGGCWYYRNRPLRDYHPYGILTVRDVLKKSSNIGTAKIALHLGEDRLDRYLRAFGIGVRTGIELPFEEPGIFWARRKWDKLTVTRVPMGHGVAVTALQMVNAYSAIANDGFLMRPRIVDRVVAADGRVIRETEPEVLARPIRPGTARLMRSLLERVTEDGGTARRARVDGYDVAGKTGTSEKVENGHYVKSKNIASFVGFIPAGDPELAVLVVVDEPQRRRTGGSVAAPAFRDICEPVVRYLHIPPEGLDSVSGLNERWLTQTMEERSVLQVN